MYKIIGPDAYDFGESQVQFVKRSSRGIIGGDKAALEKRAGHMFADKIANIHFHDDELPVHVIAIGASERYGCNRNGDRWSERLCRDRHDTFVKHAKVYKHHKNKDPKVSYGIVKASAYNEAMHRIELLLAINNSKEAAARNEGLFDEDLAGRVKSGKDIAVSMSTPVPYDVCAAPGCGNRAKNRTEYCTEDTCTRLGCKSNLCKVAQDGFVQSVDNPIACWSDISDVYRPADPIAYGAHADYIRKVASGASIGGAELAEAYGLFSDPSEEHLHKQKKVAHALYLQEKRLIDQPTREDVELSRAFSTGIQSSIDFTVVGKIAAERLPMLWGTLANEKIAMSLTEFLRVLTGYSGTDLSDAIHKTASALPGVFVRLETDPELDSYLKTNPYLPSKEVTPVSWKKWAKEQEYLYSVDPNTVRERAIRAAVRGCEPASFRKSSTAVSEDAMDLAKHYALYKIAFLSSINVEDSQLPLTARLVILQNYA